MASGEWKSYHDLPPTSVCMKYIMDVNKTGVWRTLRPVLDMEKCIMCFICWKFCPEQCIQIVDEKPKIDYDFCKGCGICANECPKNAITMVREE